ncbi:Rof/RNase P-like protein [Limtongia smithiae]|uniref:Rof/RNase P-like protein n=1 Tax=Limtongia smithiae TaxID=1125753 RepID=UPI0034CFAF3F
MSSAEKKRLGLYELGHDARRFRTYVPLHDLWQSYITDLLQLPMIPRPADTPDDEAAATRREAALVVDKRPQTIKDMNAHAARLATADLHGAYMVVHRSKCASRVGLEGIMLRESRHAFVLLTRENAVKIVPKENTVFRVPVRVPGWRVCCAHTVKASQETEVGATQAGIALDLAAKCIGCEHSTLYSFLVYGSQMQYRPADRGGRKFKSKPAMDL